MLIQCCIFFKLFTPLPCHLSVTNLCLHNILQALTHNTTCLSQLTRLIQILITEMWLQDIITQRVTMETDPRCAVHQANYYWMTPGLQTNMSLCPDQMCNVYNLNTLSFLFREIMIQDSFLLYLRLLMVIQISSRG